MEHEKQRLLLLTQDPQLVDQSKIILENNRRHLVEVRDSAVLAPLLERGADLVIIDLRLPEKTLKNVSAILGKRRSLPVLVLGSGTDTSWYQISRGSPLEVVVKAPYELDDVLAAAEQLLEKSRFLHGRLVSRSEAIQEVRERLLLTATTPLTVLITGETGSGKGVVAEALHHFSLRHDKPYKAINCAAIPENLLENELFGHERGAFTDAKAQYRGIFEQANSGTVFLDEIGEMALAAQVRLLRVLEERTITRIGGDAAIPVDVRIIAATNKNLQTAVSEGQFRRDLYHRVKVVELHLPPLRQRPEDVQLLIQHFVREFSRQDKGRFAFDDLSPAALELLEQYDWPGNVRELRNLVEHLFHLGPRRRVEPEDLLPHLESTPSMGHHLPVPTNKTPDQSERELIYFALLDLKREVAQLRQLVEERLMGTTNAPSRPIYQLEEPVFAPSEIDAEEISPTPATPVRPLKTLEKEAIQQAITQVGGNRREAAQILGIGVRTLYRKLDEYGLR